MFRTCALTAVCLVGLAFGPADKVVAEKPADKNPPPKLGVVPLWKGKYECVVKEVVRNSVADILGIEPADKVLVLNDLPINTDKDLDKFKECDHLTRVVYQKHKSNFKVFINLGPDAIIYDKTKQTYTIPKTVSDNRADDKD